MTQEEFNQISNKCEQYRYLHNRLISYESDLEALEKLKAIYVISDGGYSRNVCPIKDEEFQKDLIESIRSVYERNIIKTKLHMEEL